MPPVLVMTLQETPLYVGRAAAEKVLELDLQVGGLKAGRELPLTAGIG